MALKLSNFSWRSNGGKWTVKNYRRLHRVQVSIQLRSFCYFVWNFIICIMDITAFLFALIIYNFLLKCPFKLSIRKFHRTRYRSSDDACMHTYVRQREWARTRTRTHNSSFHKCKQNTTKSRYFLSKCSS